MIKNIYCNRQNFKLLFLKAAQSLGACFLLVYSVYGEVQLPYLWKDVDNDGIRKVVKIEPDGIIYEYPEFEKQQPDDFKGPSYRKLLASWMKDETLVLFGLSREVAEKFREAHKITHENLLGLKAKRQDFIKQYGFPAFIVQLNTRDGSNIVDRVALNIREMFINTDSYGTLTGEVAVYYESDGETPVIVKYSFCTLTDKGEFHYPDYDGRFTKSFLSTTAPFDQWKYNSEAFFQYQTNDYIARIVIEKNQLHSMCMISNKFLVQNQRPVKSP